MLLAPQALDMPLTFEDARAAGATLGSGVVMLFDESADLEAIVRRIARFFRDESCGQCVPCRIGTVRQEEALGASRRFAAWRNRRRDARRIDLRIGADGLERRRVRARQPRALRGAACMSAERLALTIDGIDVTVAAGRDDSRCGDASRHRNADALFLAVAHAGQRLPRLRRRTRRLARARSGLCAPRRSRA